VVVVTDDAILTFDDVRLTFAGRDRDRRGELHRRPARTVRRDRAQRRGKTSIFNVLSGVYRPQAGRVVFDGVDIVGWRPHRIAAAGMARTFQNVELFANLTVLDNLMLGRHSHLQYGTVAAIAGSGRRDARSSRPGKQLSPLSTFLISSSGVACPSAGCPTECRSGWSSAGLWPCSPSCCCSTSRWPA
jgi:ABC-type branched-subunit amino acid transport system ATPase component